MTYSPHLKLYLDAVQSCRQREWVQASTSWHQALATCSPLHLSEQDCVTLRASFDDLAYLGQHLPSLTPMLALLRRLTELDRMNV